MEEVTGGVIEGAHGIVMPPEEPIADRVGMKAIEIAVGNGVVLVKMGGDVYRMKVEDARNLAQGLRQAANVVERADKEKAARRKG